MSEGGVAAHTPKPIEPSVAAESAMASVSLPMTSAEPAPLARASPMAVPRAIPVSSSVSSIDALRARAEFQVREIARRLPLLMPETSCRFVADRFSEADAPPAYAIDLGAGVTASRFGLVPRAEFLARFAATFGRELFGKKPVLRLLDSDPLVVDAGLPVDEVATLIFRQKPKALQDGFIVTDAGAYLGIGTGLDLLNRVALQAQETLDELRAAQRSLVDSEKFASLGQLVAGVAHEVNTPIGVAVSAASFMNEQLSELSNSVDDNRLKRSDLAVFLKEAGEAMRLMENNLKRAGDLIQSFKKVAVDRSAEHLDDFGVRRLIDDVVASLGATLRKSRIALTIACPDDLFMYSYPGPLTQVLTNLVQNAMVHGFDEGTEGTIRISCGRDGERVVIKVADSGRGIAPEHRDKIFAPFFTTKRGKGGSGLGLHIAYNIVTQQLGGSISLETEPGRGTSFTLTLPGKVA